MAGTLAPLEAGRSEHGAIKEETTMPTAPEHDSNGPDADADADAGQPSLQEHAWQWAVWAGAKTLDGLDFAGEVVADFLGLTRSKYQWILDMQEREREEKRVRRLEARQRRQLRLEQLLEQERRRLEELEVGSQRGDNQSECDA